MCVSEITTLLVNLKLVWGVKDFRMFRIGNNFDLRISIICH